MSSDFQRGYEYARGAERYKRDQAPKNCLMGCLGLTVAMVVGLVVLVVCSGTLGGVLNHVGKQRPPAVRN